MQGRLSLVKISIVRWNLRAGFTTTWKYITKVRVILRIFLFLYISIFIFWPFLLFLVYLYTIVVPLVILFLIFMFFWRWAYLQFVIFLHIHISCKSFIINNIWNFFHFTNNFPPIFLISCCLIFFFRIRFPTK